MGVPVCGKSNHCCHKIVSMCRYDVLVLPVGGENECYSLQYSLDVSVHQANEHTHHNYCVYTFMIHVCMYIHSAISCSITPFILYTYI